MTTRPPRPEQLDDRDPNADLEHTNETRVGDGTYADGGDCLTCGVKWPCPTEVRELLCVWPTCELARQVVGTSGADAGVLAA